VVKEAEFAKKIEELLKIARRQGNFVSNEQVKELFLEIGMEEDNLSAVYEYLNSKKIGVGKEADIEESLSKEDKNYLEMYLEELSLLNEYSEGEKEAYYISAMAGHIESQKKLIEIMLPDVVGIAKLYSDQGVSIEDLIGEGNLALSVGVTMLKALESPKEVPAALAQMIMNAMEEIIASESDIKKSDGKIVDKVNKVADAAAELSKDLCRKVTIDELKLETGFSRKFIEDAIRYSGFRIEDIEENGDNNGK